ncbi:hypothetical protein VSR69_15825 [Paraburkholderia phytofirmans]|jgi:hypothetical protein|uniref:hypothetical protein n=1 Tax=Paraburkholderia sp. BL9I2N2 TaxID=1938809 RepID=UPI00104A8296|nr:hypothetical protein [Paraburkholderia sp. BL9I2N2]TCK95204.1 hypothetical protein B0G74_1814 [Paraburkholderia sp. BL9I2N2]
MSGEQPLHYERRESPRVGRAIGLKQILVRVVIECAGVFSPLIVQRLLPLPGQLHGKNVRLCVFA